MARRRTTVMLDDALIGKARRILRTENSSEAIDQALRELIRRDSLRQLADALGAGDAADDAMVPPPRRRPQ